MKRFIPVSLFLLFIFWIIWQADSKGTNYLFRWVDSIPFKDKWGHFSLYGTLALMLDFALKSRHWLLFKIRIPTAAILVITFAIVEEITQLWIPSRNFDLIDIMADFAGVFLFVFCGRKVNEFRIFLLK